MGKWFLIAGGITVVSGAIAVLIGHVRETSRLRHSRATLLQKTSPFVEASVDFDLLGELPRPVERYFRYALTEGQTLVEKATIHQSGTLRTSSKTENWSLFTARHLAVPPAPGFVWDARVDMPLATHVRVLDSYSDGVGSGRVSLLSAIPVASEAGTPELNSSALHRYLAEAVWYPTALLPQAGVEWTPIDHDAALATLTDHDTTVSLEFRFNEVGEVAGIYSPGRFGRFDGEYTRAPWEGHFRDYEVREGMRIPLYGEVGWYDDGTLQLVWKGNITNVQYEVGS